MTQWCAQARCWISCQVRCFHLSVWRSWLSLGILFGNSTHFLIWLCCFCFLGLYAWLTLLHHRTTWNWCSCHHPLRDRAYSLDRFLPLSWVVASPAPASLYEKISGLSLLQVFSSSLLHLGACQAWSLSAQHWSVLYADCVLAHACAALIDEWPHSFRWGLPPVALFTLPV